VPVPRAAKAQKKLTAPGRASFTKLCTERVKLKEKQETLKTDLTKVNERLSEMTDTYGQPLLADPREKALVVGEYKALLNWSNRGGSIDTEMMIEWAKKNAPDMVDVENSRKLELNGIDEILGAYDISPEIRAQIQQNLKLVVELVKSARPEMLVEVNDENLNLEKYRDAKEKNLIPKEILEKAEVVTGHFSFNVHKTPDNGCTACGHPRPARKKKAASLACTKCGHQEKE